MLTGFDGDGVDESGRGSNCSRTDQSTAGLASLVAQALLVFHLQERLIVDIRQRRNADRTYIAVRLKVDDN